MSAASDDLDLISGGSSPAEIEAEAARVARALDRSAVASVVGEIEAAIAPRPLRDAEPSERREAGVFEVIPDAPQSSVREALPRVVGPAEEPPVATSPPLETLEIQRPLQAGDRYDTTQQVRIPKVGALALAEPSAASPRTSGRWWILVGVGLLGMVGLGVAIRWSVASQSVSAPKSSSAPIIPVEAPIPSQPTSGLASPVPSAAGAPAPSSMLNPEPSIPPPPAPVSAGSSGPPPRPSPSPGAYGEFHGND